MAILYRSVDKSARNLSSWSASHYLLKSHVGDLITLTSSPGVQLIPKPIVSLGPKLADIVANSLKIGTVVKPTPPPPTLLHPHCFHCTCFLSLLLLLHHQDCCLLCFLSQKFLRHPHSPFFASTCYFGRVGDLEAEALALLPTRRPLHFPKKTGKG